MPLAVRSGSADVNIQNEVIGHFDRTAVSGIVENLLSNAIKYGQGKPIEMDLSRDRRNRPDNRSRQRHWH